MLMRPRAGAGFTLIELAIVIFLIALFAMIAIPLVAGMGERGLDASARRIAGTVKYLYNEAALTGSLHRLVFNLDEGTFAAKRQQKNGELEELGGTGRRQKLKGDVKFRDVTIAARGSYTSGEVTADIYPVGWMEETVIHLDREGKVLTLRLMPFTGATEIYEGYREFETQK